MFFAKIFKTLNLMFISFGFNLLLVIICSSPATSKLKEISFRVPSPISQSNAVWAYHSLDVIFSLTAFACKSLLHFLLPRFFLFEFTLKSSPSDETLEVDESVDSELEVPFLCNI